MPTESIMRNVVPDMSDIPEYASMEEAVLYVTEADVKLINNFYREIGLNELAVYETTGNFVDYYTEADDNKEGEGEKKEPGKLGKLAGSIKERGEKLINDIAAKIKGLFEKALSVIQDSIAYAATKLGGTKAFSAENLKKKLGNREITIKGGDYTNLQHLARGDGASTDILKAFHNAAKAKANKNNDEGVLKDLEQLIGGEINTKNVKAWLVGPDKGGIKLDAKGIDDICTIIKDSKSAIEGLRSIYNQADKTIANLATSIKDLRQNNNITNKDIDKQYKNDTGKNFGAKTNTAIASAITIIYGTAISTYVELIKKDIAIAVKVLATVKKDGGEKEKPNNESAVVDQEETNNTNHYSEEVDSLFDWSF
jgi:hypothetical protein